MQIKPFVFLFALSGLTSVHAQKGDNKDHKDMTPPIPHSEIPDAPFLSAEQSMKTFDVADDFEVQLVAAEPLVDMPVAMKFDADGSLWVAEMIGYMLDLDATDEDKPMGNIVVLRDTDGDGRMDDRTVFLDNILLPRALELYEDGLLYADQEQLYFTRRDGLTAGSTRVVDPDYAEGGNVEHKPNGLMRGIDNWLYNAKSAYRYKRDGDEWIKESTAFRGQWGITQDNYGRLFHNSNSTLAVGEFLPPNLLRANPNAKFKGLHLRSVLGNNRIHPIRINPGVNRAYISKANGYDKSTLDPETGKLRTPTAAAGLEYYRGDQFPSDYQDTLFITVPCGNLVSVLKIDEKGESVVAANPLGDRDIWSSTDERFRPVAAANAPDGTMYIADFSHGIIQHKTYLTSYLRDQYERRELDKPAHGPGRIYRLVSKDAPVPAIENLREFTDAQLVETLASANGWKRDTAQRLLIEREAEVEAALRKLAISAEASAPSRIHALYTLDALGGTTGEFLGKVIKSTNDEKLTAAAVTIAMENGGDIFANVAPFLPSIEDTDYLTPFKLRALAQQGSDASLASALKLLKSREKSRFASAAVISGLEGHEGKFAELAQQAGFKPDNFRRWIAIAQDNSAKPKGGNPGDHLAGADNESFHRGEKLFRQNCMGCHGQDGAGLANLGPLLDGSDWVTGSEKKLSRILLHGLMGPITLNGKKFEGPAVMPGLAMNSSLTDQHLADMATYIRNSWGNKAPVVTASTIAAERAATSNRSGAPYTEPELIEELK